MDTNVGVCRYSLNQQTLIISNYASPLISLIPDDVTIRYEEVVNCESTVRTGETKDDILADVLEITFTNGTILELEFLYI